MKSTQGPVGRWHGANGSLRKIRFLENMMASFLSDNGLLPPFGASGGEPGACGRNYVIRADGRQEQLSCVASTDMHPYEVFVIETPGGGGFGNAA